MRKIFLSLQIILLVVSLAGCSPSFDPKAEEHFRQGIEYERQDNDALAMQEFTKAIEIDPDYTYAYYNRALAYYRNHDYANSIVDYNKAIELSPDNVYWILERGFVYMKNGEPDKAILDLERGKELGVPSEYKEIVDQTLAQLKQ